MAARAEEFIAVEEGMLATETSEGEDTRGLQPRQPGLRRAWATRAAAAAVSIGALGLAAVAVSRHAAPAAGAKSGDVDSTVSYVGGVALVAELAAGLSSSAKLAQESEDGWKEFQGQMKTMGKPLMDLKAGVKIGTSHNVNLTKMGNLTEKDLLHPTTADRHDGNVCADDEEVHANLCYKTCSSLTNGKYPIRTTAFSCCMEEPCSFFNSKFTSLLAPCSGFDSAGSEEGKGCPHAPGACMPNEEFSLGVCYKKCAILTNNSFPYRSAASSCCRYNSHVACLDALNTLTDPAYDVGGGLGDHLSSTPNASHAPMLSLTEATA